MRSVTSALFVFSTGLLLALAAPGAIRAQVLTIHQINVQQGDCTLLVGPDGTTFLIDAGNRGKGTSEVVPYLQSIGIQPGDGLDFMLATHRDSDHLGGLDEVIDAGYDVESNVWDNGSDKSGGADSQITQFLTPQMTQQRGRCRRCRWAMSSTSAAERRPRVSPSEGACWGTG